MAKKFFNIVLTQAQRKNVRPGVLELVAIDYFKPSKGKPKQNIKLTDQQKGFISKVTGNNPEELEIVWRPVMTQHSAMNDKELLRYCDTWTPEKGDQVLRHCDFWSLEKEQTLRHCDFWTPEEQAPLRSCDVWNPESTVTARSCDIWTPEATSGLRTCDWWTPESMPKELKKEIIKKIKPKK